MGYEKYNVINVEVRNKVAYATINNPPINIITRPLLDDLVRLSTELEADPDLLVVVLRSANPEFFIAHFDVSAILEFPTDKTPKHEDYANAFYHDMCERFRLMSKVTIAQIEGRVSAADRNWRCLAICGSACTARPSSIRWRCHWASCRAERGRSGCRG